MKRKLLAGFMVVCLILTLLPATALAADKVAEVGGVSYATLEEAIKNVPNNGTIKLLTDFVLSDKITVNGGTFTLDMDEHTISLGATKTSGGAIIFSGNSDVTITGNGVVDFDESYLGKDAASTGRMFEVDSDAVLTIENGTFHAGLVCVLVDNNAKAYIKGGEYSAHEVYSYNKWLLNRQDGTNSRFFVSGGTFEYYDPYNSKTENPEENFCAEGYTTISEDKNDKIYYTVVPAVAEADGKYYATLAEAVDAVVSSTDKAGTVTLLKDAQGCGIGLFNSKGHTDVDLTIDFGGHTYTSGDPAVGSAGTESQAFHLEQGNKVTLKNGKITVVEDSANTNTQMLIQNYCDLTLKDLVVDTSNSTKVSYAMSNNCGNVNIIGDTSIKAHDGAVAFDVCGYANYTGVHVTVNTTGQIVGKVELSRSSGNDKPVRLSILNGDFTGAFDNQDDRAEISITGGSFHNADVSGFVADGYYTVTFNCAGGDPIPSQVVAKGATFTLPGCTHSSYHYKFDGWKCGNATYYAGDEVEVNSNMTFTAQWKERFPDGPSSGGSSSVSDNEYAVTVDAGKHGDVSVSPKWAEEGDTVTITADPDNGYVVDEVIVTDKNGDDIRVRDRGDGEYTFTMPDSKVTVEVTFVEAGDELSFVDVAKSDYYYDAVKWAVENGVTTGVTDTIFAPGNPCTRAQTVTFLWRAAGMPQAANRVNPFTDVSVNDYYYEAVLWAVENGITGGTTATTFSPNATCTRAQVVTFLWRYSKEDASILPMFTDVAEGDYYYGAVAWAVENGVTTGVTDTSFVPGNPCTRGQIVTFLYRYMGK